MTYVVPLVHQKRFSQTTAQNSRINYGLKYFEKLKIEQKFTPIYSPQCNGRIKGFHKFLKATIAKQLETHVEWDDLVWKAMAAYNFFPTESSGISTIFSHVRMCKAAVKHTLLESENPKYLGTDDSMNQHGTDDKTVPRSSAQPK